MVLGSGSDAEDDAKSFYTSQSHNNSFNQPPSVTTYPPIAAPAAIRHHQRNKLQPYASSDGLEPLNIQPGYRNESLSTHHSFAGHTIQSQQAQWSAIPGPRSAASQPQLNTKRSQRFETNPIPSTSASACASQYTDDEDDDERDGLTKSQSFTSTTAAAAAEEHFFLIGDDASAIPFFQAPRVIVANGPAPAPEDLIWHDEASYQAVLNKSTARCVNILGETALKEPQEGNGKYKLKLIEMCDDRVPSNMRAAMGKGYYCCLMQEQEYLPRACMAVYHINPHYSTEFLYRVKAFSYDSQEPLVAEQPESILLALIGRQMAISNCLVGVISNGSLLVVVEACPENSVHGASLRTHPQSFIDCAHDWSDDSRGSLRASDGQVHRSQHHQLHSLPSHAHPHTENPPLIDPLARNPRNSSTYPWEAEFEARQQGFDRADMMFAWYAVMLYAHERHLNLVLCALQIFEAWAAHTTSSGLIAETALQNESRLNPERSRYESSAGKERYEELQSDDLHPHLDVDEREALYRRRRRNADPAGDNSGPYRRTSSTAQSTAIQTRAAQDRAASKINAPAPAWIRPVSTASSRHHSQAYDYNYGGYSYTAVDSAMPSPTISTPLEPASPAEFGGGAPGSGNHASWYGGLAESVSGISTRASGFSIPGTAWLRANMPSSSPRRPSPQSESSSISQQQAQGLFGWDNEAPHAGVHASASDNHPDGKGTPNSPGWVQWSPATSPPPSREGVGAGVIRSRNLGEEMELREMSKPSGRNLRGADADVGRLETSLRQLAMEAEDGPLLPPPPHLMTRRFGSSPALGGGGSAGGPAQMPSANTVVGSLAQARGLTNSPRTRTRTSSTSRFGLVPDQASLKSKSSNASLRSGARVMAGGAEAI
ncbi:unnamed protein product [Sympodiomycopsis kandeliae]